MRSYTLRVFRNVEERHESDCSVHTTAAFCDGKTCVRETTHVELGTYENLTVPPWIPPKGSFFRFRDHQPPGKPVDHNEVAGYVEEVVTCFYSTRTVIEVYVKPR
jgi:hypothetical protein